MVTMHENATDYEATDFEVIAVQSITTVAPTPSTTTTATAATVADNDVDDDDIIIEKYVGGKLGETVIYSKACFLYIMVSKIGGY